MIKIICKINFDVEKDAGAKDGDLEILKAWLTKSPYLRPCGKYHAWVEKTYCKKRCPLCMKWTDTEE